MLQTIYNNMWEKFKKASETNQYELDTYLLDPKSDTRRGISILAYLNQGDTNTLSEILNFQKVVKNIEPNQYYHPADELHLTVLPVISCLPNFQLSKTMQEICIDIFQSVMNKSGRIKIKYQGITASTNCVVIQGFPFDNKLEKLRNRLRDQLNRANIEVNFDSRYKLVTAHSSAIRFCVPITDGKQLLRLCSQYRNHPFGNLILHRFELVFNNWYQNLSITKPLSHFTLDNLK